MKENKRTFKYVISVLSLVAVLFVCIIQVYSASKPLEQESEIRSTGVQQTSTGSNLENSDIDVSSNINNNLETQQITSNSSTETSVTAFSSGIESEINNTNTLPIVINDVNNVWKEKYSDINITSEWLSPTCSATPLALFGSLKSDPQQGVAVVLLVNKDGSKVYDERFLCPEKNGALKVVDIGATNFNMIVTDDSGNNWEFHVFNGFLKGN